MITKIDQRLHHASRTGNLNEIKKILEEHYPGEKTSEIVNAKDEDGYTPLTYVILSNQIDVSKKKEIIAYLISQDADVNVIDNRDFDLIFLLIDNIYSIHRDEKIETNEKYRAINEQIDFAKYFIEQYKPDVLHKTEDIRKKQRTVGNLLEKIVRDAPVNFFDFLMESYPELLTAKQRNNSLLTYAEIEDDSKLLENIYNRIAKDPNHLKAYIRETNWSAENLMHLKKILKISSANPIDTKQVFTEVTSTIQDNPLHKLILYQVTLYSNTSALDITNAVKFLVEQSPALLYQKNSRGQTPIDAAFDERNLSILSILMEIDFPEESIKRYCSSIDWTKNEEIDFMAKILVLMAKNPSRMLLLWEGIPPQKRQRVLNTEVGGIVAQESLNHLQDRLDVNPVPANTVYGINGTQLHFLVMEGTEDEVANFIKDTNADVNSKDKRGKTPLHYAMQRGELVIIEQLLSHSQIDVNAKDHDGNSILHDAVKYNSPLLKLIEQAKKLKTPPLDKIEIYVFNNELKSVIDMTYEDTFKTVAKDYLLFDEIQSVNLQRDLFKAEKRKIKKEIVDQGPYKPLDSSKQEHTVPEIFESGLFFQDKSKESFFHGKAAELYESEIVRPLMNLIAMAIKGYYDKEKVESRFKSIISSGEHALGSISTSFFRGVYTGKNSVFSGDAEVDGDNAWTIQIHEMCHFVVDKVFKNLARPYFDENVKFAKLSPEMHTMIASALKEVTIKLNEENIKPITISLENTLHIGENIAGYRFYLIRKKGLDWVEKNTPQLEKVYSDYFRASSYTFDVVLEKTIERMEQYTPQSSDEARAKALIMHVKGYNQFQQNAELIVRVPQIIAALGNEKGKDWLQQQVPELLDYYENVFNREIEIYCKEQNIEQFITTEAPSLKM